jgi:hypothetical protein
MSPRNRGCSIVSHDFPGDLRTRLAEVEHGIGLRPAMATLRPGRFVIAHMETLVVYIV